MHHYIHAYACLEYGPRPKDRPFCLVFGFFLCLFSCLVRFNVLTFCDVYFMYIHVCLLIVDHFVTFTISMF